jgi:hypothetical protein
MAQLIPVRNHAAAENLLKNRSSKKLGHNTYMYKTKNAYEIQYRDTVVVTRFPDDSVKLNSGGWRTPTTKQRINEYIPIGYSLYQEKGLWYVSTPTGETLLFQDGMKIDPHTDVVTGHGGEKGKSKKEKLAKDMINKIRKYAKEMTRLFIEGKLEQPSSGDCLYCSTKNRKTGEVLGRSMRDPSHILSHMEEKYYVPSLLFNAIDEFYPASAAYVILSLVWPRETGVKKLESDFYKEIVQTQFTRAIVRYLKRELELAS